MRRNVLFGTLDDTFRPCLGDSSAPSHWEEVHDVVVRASVDLQLSNRLVDFKLDRSTR